MHYLFREKGPQSTLRSFSETKIFPRAFIQPPSHSSKCFVLAASLLPFDDASCRLCTWYCSNTGTLHRHGSPATTYLDSTPAPQFTSYRVTKKPQFHTNQSIPKETHRCCRRHSTRTRTPYHSTRTRTPYPLPLPNILCSAARLWSFLFSSPLSRFKVCDFPPPSTLGRLRFWPPSWSRGVPQRQHQRQRQQRWRHSFPCIWGEATPTATFQSQQSVPTT